MFFPWYAAMMLAFESNAVIGLRLLKFAAGGADARDEAHRMFSEKVDAALEAGATLMGGGAPDAVIGRYREHVAANVGRLCGPGGPV